MFDFIKIDNNTYEMYSSIINSKTFNWTRDSYCSLFKNVGSIGRDDELEGYLKSKNLLKNVKILANPPFTEIMIKRMIKLIESIIENLKIENL